MSALKKLLKVTKPRRVQRQEGVLFGVRSDSRAGTKAGVSVDQVEKEFSCHRSRRCHPGEEEAYSPGSPIDVGAGRT